MNVTSTDAPKSRHLAEVATSLVYTFVTVIVLGFAYPAVIWGISTVAFSHQAGGSIIPNGKTALGADLVGQNFAKAKYFHGRLSAAGKGYDPTSTGGTNLGPTSKKLIDATRASIAAVRKENPGALGDVPSDLVTSSASGIDAEITVEGAMFQVTRVARARRLDAARVREVVEKNVIPRTFGVLGEPRINVLHVNRALDALEVNR